MNPEYFFNTTNHLNGETKKLRFLNKNNEIIFLKCSLLHFVLNWLICRQVYIWFNGLVPYRRDCFTVINSDIVDEPLLERSISLGLDALWPNVTQQAETGELLLNLPAFDHAVSVNMTHYCWCKRHLKPLFCGSVQYISDHVRGAEN